MAHDREPEPDLERRHGEGDAGERKQAIGEPAPQTRRTSRRAGEGRISGTAHLCDGQLRAETTFRSTHASDEEKSGVILDYHETELSFIEVLDASRRFNSGAARPRRRSDPARPGPPPSPAGRSASPAPAGCGRRWCRGSPRRPDAPGAPGRRRRDAAWPRAGRGGAHRARASPPNARGPCPYSADTDP